MAEAGDIKWLDPIRLNYQLSNADDSGRFLKALRKQFKTGLEAQGYKSEAIKQSVYVIRMHGAFLVSYKKANSPVLYVGRGNASTRIASHLGRWLHDVNRFGHDTSVEIRIALPLRKKRSDYYKNVEADLIMNFRKLNGSLPFFNRRPETKFVGKVDYGTTQSKKLRSMIGIGSGNRPQWAIKPTPANPVFATYLTGTDPE